MEGKMRPGLIVNRFMVTSVPTCCKELCLPHVVWYERTTYISYWVSYYIAHADLEIMLYS